MSVFWRMTDTRVDQSKQINQQQAELPWKSEQHSVEKQGDKSKTKSPAIIGGKNLNSKHKRGPGSMGSNTGIRQPSWKYTEVMNIQETPQKNRVPMLTLPEAVEEEEIPPASPPTAT